MTLQGKFEGLFPPLLRLASSQFPHLCLVEDWLTSEPSLRAPMPLAPRSPRVITDDIEAAYAVGLADAHAEDEAATECIMQ